MTASDLFRSLLFGSVLIATLVGTQQAEPAEKLPSAVVAVVDMQRINKQSVAAQEIRKQVKDHRAAFQAKINKLDEALRREEQELKRQQAILAPKNFSQKRQQFQDKLGDVQRQVQDRVRELDRVLAEATRQIQLALYPIFVELSTERGFDIVLNTTQHVFSRQSLSITEDVLTRLNERLPRVQVTIPPVD